MSTNPSKKYEDFVIKGVSSLFGGSQIDFSEGIMTCFPNDYRGAVLLKGITQNPQVHNSVPQENLVKGTTTTPIPTYILRLYAEFAVMCAHFFPMTKAGGAPVVQNAILFRPRTVSGGVSNGTITFDYTKSYTSQLSLMASQTFIQNGNVRSDYLMANTIFKNFANRKVTLDQATSKYYEIDNKTKIKFTSNGCANTDYFYIDDTGSPIINKTFDAVNTSTDPYVFPSTINLGNGTFFIPPVGYTTDLTTAPGKTINDTGVQKYIKHHNKTVVGSKFLRENFMIDRSLAGPAMIGGALEVFTGVEFTDAQLEALILANPNAKMFLKHDGSILSPQTFPLIDDMFKKIYKYAHTSPLILDIDVKNILLSDPNGVQYNGDIKINSTKTLAFKSSLPIAIPINMENIFKEFMKNFSTKSKVYDKKTEDEYYATYEKIFKSIGNVWTKESDGKYINKKNVALTGPETEKALIDSTGASIAEMNDFLGRCVLEDPENADRIKNCLEFIKDKTVHKKSTDDLLKMHPLIVLKILASFGFKIKQVTKKGVNHQEPETVKEWLSRSKKDATLSPFVTLIENNKDILEYLTVLTAFVNSQKGILSATKYDEKINPDLQNKKFDEIRTGMRFAILPNVSSSRIKQMKDIHNTRRFLMNARSQSPFEQFIGNNNNIGQFIRNVAGVNTPALFPNLQYMFQPGQNMIGGRERSDIELYLKTSNPVISDYEKMYEKAIKSLSGIGKKLSDASQLKGRNLIEELKEKEKEIRDQIVIIYDIIHLATYNGISKDKLKDSDLEEFEKIRNEHIDTLKKTSKGTFNLSKSISQILKTIADKLSNETGDGELADIDV